MNKVAWIVQFKQSQLETPHASVLAVMSVRNEDCHPVVPTACCLFKIRKLRLCSICQDRTSLITMNGKRYPNKAADNISVA